MCQCAVLESAEKHATLSVSRSRATFQVRERFSEQVFRSEDLNFFLSSLTISLMKSLKLELFHLANRFNLATACWNFVVVWKFSILVDETCSRCQSLVFGKLQWRLLHLLSFASRSTYLTDVHFLLRLRRVLFLVLLQGGAMLLLCLQLYLGTEDSVDTIRLFIIAGNCVCIFHSTIVMLTRPCETIGTLRCDQLFSL